MPEVEEVRKAICYITGEIKLEFRPPNIQIEPKATVDERPAFVKTTEGEDPKIWKYLAVVEKGEHTVEVELGNVCGVRKITARVGQVTTLNFHFTSAE